MGRAVLWINDAGNHGPVEQSSHHRSAGPGSLIIPAVPPSTAISRQLHHATGLILAFSRFVFGMPIWVPIPRRSPEHGFCFFRG